MTAPPRGADRQHPRQGDTANLVIETERDGNGTKLAPIRHRRRRPAPTDNGVPEDVSAAAERLVSQWQRELRKISGAGEDEGGDA